MINTSPSQVAAEQSELKAAIKSDSARSVISFEPFENSPGWEKAQTWVLGLIEQYHCRSVLEIGSGANPTLSPAIVSKLGIRYVANDIDADELSKADTVFDRWVGDVTRDEIPPHMEAAFDLVFSRMVNEHVKDGRAYHANIHRLLAAGGISAHCFSTLYSLPFLANRLLPERVSDFLLHIFNPRDPFKRGKFRAYYSWSRGPSDRMIANFESLGFEMLKYTGYFGHGYYWRIPFIHRLELKKASRLVARPIASLTSFAMLVARKRR
jgi:hypothetical protein